MTDVLARLSEPSAQEDPYPTYAWLRAHDPVSWSGQGKVYVLSRHADIKWAFNSPDLRAPEPEQLSTLVPRANDHPSLRLLLRTLPMNNPPTHTRLRRLVQRDFTAQRVNGIRESVEQACDQSLDNIVTRLRDGEIVDIHSDFSRTLAMSVIADLLGVPEADRPALAALVVRMLVVTTPGVPAERLADADSASAEVEEYFAALAKQRRQCPEQDLISALVSAHANDPDQLSDSELMTMIWALWLSGFETSAAGIDTALIAMVHHPEHTDRLAGSRTDVVAFVSEALRHQSPTMLTGVFRIAARELEIGGVRIPAGTDIRMLTASANRDPAAFPDADRFDPSRNSAAAVTFGHGIRYCLGANLGLMEISTALRLLYTRCPGLTLADGAVRRHSLTLRAFDRLPVALAGTASGA